jgi:large subunit ribosomal protein L25
MTKNTIFLKVDQRKTPKKAKDLIKESRIAGVLYGHGINNQPLECDYQSFHKVFVQAGESTVIDLELGGKTMQVLIHQIAYDPVTNAYIHIDFFAPDMTKAITTHIPIRITGESICVKDLGGILVRNKESITIKCLPKDLPHDIEVDISALKEFYDAVTIADISTSSVITILDADDTILVSVQPPRVEEVETTAPAEGEVSTAEEGAEAGESTEPSSTKAPGGTKESDAKEGDRKGGKKDAK